MIRMLVPILLALSCLPAQTTTTYVDARYNKLKPGMTPVFEEYQKLIFGKGEPAQLRSDPEHLGAAMLRRVFPTGEAKDHDTLFLSFSAKPPRWGSPLSPEYLAAIGVTAAENTAKLNSYRTVVRSELWTDVYRHGALKKGDLVQIRFMKPPPGATESYLEVNAEYESEIRAQMVKQGVMNGQQLYRLWGATEQAHHTFVSLFAYPSSEALFKNWPSRIDLFRSAHSGKNYGRYLEKYNHSSNMVDAIVYRVSDAVLR